MYLKIKDFKGYDDYYYKLNAEDNTWKDVLHYIEIALEDKYDESNKLVGIKLDVEIVTSIPNDADWEE